jgi:hypothetical protein
VALRPVPQPGVVEPAPEQLAAVEHPADADQPRLHDQDGAERAVADRVLDDQRLEDQAGKDPQASQAHQRRYRARHRRQVAHPAADQEAQPPPEEGDTEHHRHRHPARQLGHSCVRHRADRGVRIDVADEPGHPDRLTPDLVPGSGVQAPDPLEPALHAACERNPGHAQHHGAEHACRPEHPGRGREEPGHRVGGGTGQAHAVDHPSGQASVRGSAGGGDQNQQRDEGQRGQRGEAQGPLHELELPAAPVQIPEPELAPYSFDAPERRTVHRPARATARHRRARPSHRAVAPPPARQRGGPRRPPLPHHDRRVITKPLRTTHRRPVKRTAIRKRQCGNSNNVYIAVRS